MTISVGDHLPDATHSSKVNISMTETSLALLGRLTDKNCAFDCSRGFYTNVFGKTFAGLYRPCGSNLRPKALMPLAVCLLMMPMLWRHGALMLAQQIKLI